MKAPELRRAPLREVGEPGVDVDALALVIERELDGCAARPVNGLDDVDVTGACRLPRGESDDV